MHDIYEFLAMCQPKFDKLYHLYWGCISATVLYSLFDWKKRYIHIVLPFGIAILKELTDEISGLGKFEIVDIIFTIIPNVVPYIILKIKNK